MRFDRWYGLLSENSRPLTIETINLVAYPEPCQTYTIEPFAKIVTGLTLENPEGPSPHCSLMETL